LVDRKGSKEIIDRIYDGLVVRDGDERYVTLDTDHLELFLDITRARFPKDPEGKKRRYGHLILCLTYVHPMISMAPREFNHNIKLSIEAIGELFSQTINFGL
jgi:hypothetical protein